MGNATISWKFNKSGRFKLDVTRAINQNTLMQMGNTALKILNNGGGPRGYVPYRGGTLQESGKVSGVNVADARFYLNWDAKIGSAESEINKINESYARYVYEGMVYGPNKQRKDKKTGEIVWYSAADEKTPTGDFMTYHSENGRDHWDRVIQQGGIEYDNFRKQCKDILVRELNGR